MSTVTPLSFNVKEDFVFQVGAKQEEIKVPRLLHKNAGKVLRMIGTVVADKNASAVKSIGAAARASAIASESAFKEYAELLKKIQPAMLEAKNVTLVEEVLVAVSEGAFTSKIIGEMQYEEVVKITTYLIEKNFEPLKNFGASLQAISTSEN